MEVIQSLCARDDERGTSQTGDLVVESRGSLFYAVPPPGASPTRSILEQEVTKVLFQREAELREEVDYLRAQAADKDVLIKMLTDQNRELQSQVVAMFKAVLDKVPDGRT